MNEVAMDAPAQAGPRTITIRRSRAIAGAVATALVVAALAIALIVGGGSSETNPPFGGPGGPGMGAFPDQAEGMPAPPSGGEAPSLPQGVPGGAAPTSPTDPAPEGGGTGSGK